MVGNSIGVPPEVMGLVVLGPFLSAVNMVHLVDKKKHYLFEIITGSFSFPLLTIVNLNLQRTC